MVAPLVGFASILLPLTERPTQTVMRAVDRGTRNQLTATARRTSDSRPKDAAALGTLALCLVWQQRLGLAKLDRMPKTDDAMRVRERLNAFRGKPTPGLLLAWVQFDRDFDSVLIVPGQGKWKEGWAKIGVETPDGTKYSQRIKSFDFIGPSDAELGKQRRRLEELYRMAPKDPEVLLLRASRITKENPTRARFYLRKAEAAGARRIQPLSTRIAAWEIRQSPAARTRLSDYLRRTANDRVTIIALRGNPELAKLLGRKPSRP